MTENEIATIAGDAHYCLKLQLQVNGFYELILISSLRVLVPLRENLYGRMQRGLK